MSDETNISVLHINDKNLNQVVYQRVQKCLHNFAFTEILETDSADTDHILKLLKKINHDLVLLIDSRDSKFVFDYSCVKKPGVKLPSMFLKYEADPVENCVGLHEDGTIELINSENKDQWADAFSLVNTLFISKQELNAQLSHSKSLSKIFSTLLKKYPERAIPVPEWKEEARPCLFLDRDGVLLEDLGYVYKVEDLNIIPGAVSLINWAKKESWHVIVVSNQSGVARGFFTERELDEFTKEIQRTLTILKADPDAFYYCPYYEKGSVPKYSLKSISRKPLPGLFLQAARDFAIDFDKSYMIGDKISDCVALGGMQSFLIKGKYPLSGSHLKVFENFQQILLQVKQSVHRDLATGDEIT